MVGYIRRAVPLMPVLLLAALTCPALGRRRAFSMQNRAVDKSNALAQSKWTHRAIVLLLLALMLAHPVVFSTRTCGCGYIRQVLLETTLLLIGLLWGGRILAHGTFSWAPSAMHTAVLAYWGCALASLFTSSSMLRSMNAFQRVTGFVVFLYFIVSSHLRDRWAQRAVLGAVCAAAFLVSKAPALSILLGKATPCHARA